MCEGGSAGVSGGRGGKGEAGTGMAKSAKERRECAKSASAWCVVQCAKRGSAKVWQARQAKARQGKSKDMCVQREEPPSPPLLLQIRLGES